MPPPPVAAGLVPHPHRCAAVSALLGNYAVVCRPIQSVLIVWAQGLTLRGKNLIQPLFRLFLWLLQRGDELVGKRYGIITVTHAFLKEILR